MRSAAAAALVAVIAVSVGWSADQAPPLSYELEDQFGETHTAAECDGSVVLLLGGGRKGIAYVDSWTSELRRTLTTEFGAGSVCSVGFAHLKGAPFFVKKKIVNSFSKDPEEWVLLDWKGSFARKWGAEKDTANCYIFDREGQLVLHEALRDVDQEALSRIVAAVRTAMGDS